MNQGPQPDDAIGRSAMTKAMWRILPLILLAYMVAYIDRVNVSFASLQMNDDLKFSATIYGLGGGLFFLGYALFEVPSSLMLARFRAPQWIARIMITWGLLAAGMMFVRTPLQFYVMRFLLGVAKAGFFPSVIYYFAAGSRWPAADGPSAGSMWRAHWHQFSWARFRAACWGLTAWLAFGDGNGCSSCKVCPPSCWA